MSNNTDSQAEGITWISPQSLIKLRLQASLFSLNKSKIHAKQGGAYLSSFKGRGMEFDESRVYQAGDDIRNMDWRVTARTGTAHTKVFCEERERPVLLWLDLNSSMMFATRNKFKAVIATELASLIAWNAAKNNDRVGGLIFSSDEHIEIKPRRGKTAVLDFIGRACKHTAWSSEKKGSDRNMAKAVTRLHQVAHPGSLIFMMSDFKGMDKSAQSHLASIARHNDVVLIKITDPIEEQLPRTGNFRITDGDEEVQIHATEKNYRERYHQRFVDEDEKLATLCRKNRIFMIRISTDDDIFVSFKDALGIHTGDKSQFRSARR